jgi:hypothetical protein
MPVFSFYGDQEMEKEEADGHIGQMLLWGEEKESYDNDESERISEAENMAT